MTNAALARSYLRKAAVRLSLLPLLQRKGAYSDVVREAQEIVELALKAILRQVGVEPPKWHDVGELLREYRTRFREDVAERIPELAKDSEWLRGERELSFYGDVDFIPTEEYEIKDGRRAIRAAKMAVQTARLVLRRSRSR